MNSELDSDSDSSEEEEQSQQQAIKEQSQQQAIKEQSQQQAGAAPEGPGEDSDSSEEEVAAEVIAPQIEEEMSFPYPSDEKLNQGENAATHFAKVRLYMGTQQRFLFPEDHATVADRGKLNLTPDSMGKKFLLTTVADELAADAQQKNENQADDDGQLQIQPFRIPDDRVPVFQKCDGRRGCVFGLAVERGDSET